MNEKDINESKKEKNPGDFLTENVNPKEAIHDRKRKRNGILSDMRAILEDIPLGSKRLEIGLILRNAWSVNGTQYNLEVWCSYSEKDLEVLNVLDRKILKLVTGSHSKASCEMLYLETGCLPLSEVIIAGPKRGRPTPGFSIFIRSSVRSFVRL